MNMTTWCQARVVALFLLLALGGCDEAQDRPMPPPRPVLTTVVGGSGVEKLALVGTVEPRYQTDLSFRVFGRIVARDVEVGDVVHKGERVAALDPTALELTVRSQRAALANAQATLDNAAAVEQRQRTLHESNITSQAVLESAEQARIAAEAQVTSARSNLTKSGEQLSYAELHTDYDGVVTKVSAEVGQVVSVGQTVVTVARPDAREAVVDIPESAVHGVALGTKFDVALQLDERIRATGVLRELAPEADSITRSRRVRITLIDPPDTFRLGTTITARIKPGANAPMSTRVPASAVLEREGNARVFVVDEVHGIVLEQRVEIISRDDGHVTLKSALKPGARVVTAGVSSLKSGQHVHLEGDTD
jgi:RND family efflux transporter MFP subunit